ncbi:MAG TPA: hypothetical protein VE397_04760 [Stellaceae bacterium]|nr:hypothetical protein [Stellaceae bacterium]
MATLLLVAAAVPSALAQSTQGAPSYQFQDTTSNSLREQVIRQSAGPAAATASTAAQPTFQDVTSSAFREQVVRQSAHSAADASSSDAGSRYASTAAMVAGKRDVVGSAGAQDDLARQIYQPGSRPAGW